MLVTVGVCVIYLALEARSTRSPGSSMLLHIKP
jgi:hypothetical protein